MHSELDSAHKEHGGVLDLTPATGEDERRKEHKFLEHHDRLKKEKLRFVWFIQHAEEAVDPATLDLQFVASSL